MLSGAAWVARYPTSRDTTDLVGNFRTNVETFLTALGRAGATVSIAATLRPVKRAFLMHYSYCIAVEGLAATDVPTDPNIDIDWVHKDAHGDPDVIASRAAAREMVRGYGIVDKPSLTSRHTEGLAIDMTISWGRDLSISSADGTVQTITSTPRDGMNSDLQQVGRTYGVIKSRRGEHDPPHWSNDGF